MSMTTIPREVRKRFGHKSCSHSVFFCDRLHHIFKKSMTICCHQSIGIQPVHFKLPIGIFVIILVGSPTQGQHCITDFCNNIKPSHQGLLVIAGFTLVIAFIRELFTVGGIVLLKGGCGAVSPGGGTNFIVYVLPPISCVALVPLVLLICA